MTLELTDPSDGVVNLSSANQVTDVGTDAYVSTTGVRLTFADDDTPQAARLATVTVTCSSGSQTVVTSASITVLDDDAEPFQISFAEASVTAREGTSAVLNVRKLGGSTGVQPEITVGYSVISETAASSDIGSEFASGSGTIRFLPQVSAEQLVIPVVNDNILELAETFSIRLDYVSPEPYGTIASPGAAQVTIPASDIDVAIIGFAATSLRAEAIEGTDITLQVTRSQATASVSARWQLVDGDGNNVVCCADFSATSGTVSFNPSTSVATIVIGVQADSTAELREDYSVELTAVSPAAINSNGASVVSVPANGFPLGIVVVDQASTGVSGDEGETVRITVRRDGGSCGALSGTWGIHNSPTNLVVVGSDFDATSGSYAFAAGETETTVDIAITDDTDSEEAETFYFRLSDLVDSEGGCPFQIIVVDSGHQVTAITISESDHAYGRLGFASTSFEVAEPDGEFATPLTVIVQRTGGTTGEVSASWVVSNLTAGGSATDLSPAAGTVEFADGEASQSFRLYVHPDGFAEAAERFRVQLTSASGGAGLNSAARIAEVVISTNDDLIQFESDTVTVNEGSTFSLTLVRDGFLDSEVSVRYRIVSGSATDGVDFQVTSPDSDTIVFSDGLASMTIDFEVADDTVAEATEQFTVVLFGTSDGVSIGSIGTATVSIAFNDGAAGVIGFADETADNTIIAEGATTSFILTRSPSLVAADVTWTLTSNFGRDVSSDFDADSITGTASFAAGASSARFDVTARADTLPDVLHSYQVTLSSPTSGATLVSSPAATLTINPNDDPHGEVSLSSAAVVIGTDSSDGTIFRALNIEASRTGGTLGTVTVSVQISYNSGAESTNAVLSVTAVDIEIEAGSASGSELQPIVADASLSTSGTFRIVITGVSVAGAAGDDNVQAAATVGEQSITCQPPINTVAGVVSVRPTSAVELSEIFTDENSVEIIRTGGTYGAVTFSWGITGTNILQDFTANSGQETIAHASASVQVTIPVLADNIAELEETFGFRVSLSLETGQVATLGSRNTVGLVILPNQQPSGHFGFATGTAARTVGNEGSSVQFTIGRDLSTAFDAARAFILSQTASVSWTLTSASRDASVEFEAASGTVDFAVGQVEGILTLQVSADSTPEMFELFELRLTGATNNGRLVSSAITREVGIAANEDPHGEITLTALEMSVTNLRRSLDISIGRSGGQNGRVTAIVAIVYTSTGETSEDVLGTTTANVVIEENVAVGAVSLSVLESALLSTSGFFRATITATSVTNGLGDDNVYSNATLGSTVNRSIQPPSIAVAGAVQLASGAGREITEPESGTTEETIELRRVGGTYGSVTASWIITDATTADFVAISGMATFEHGEASNDVIIGVRADNDAEFQEDFDFSVSVPEGITSLGSPSSATLTIPLNDQPTGYFGFSADLDLDAFVTTAEGQVVSFTVVRDLHDEFESARDLILASTAEVDWAVTRGGDIADIDFEAATGTVIFDEGQVEAQIQLVVRPDGSPETFERFQLTLTHASDNAEIIDARAVADIGIPANENPHGVIDFSSADVVIGTTSSGNERLLSMTISRSSGGAIGDVVVQIAIEYTSNNGESTADVVASAVTQGTILEGATSASVEKLIRGAALLSESGTFTATILTTTVLNGRGDSGVYSNASLGTQASFAVQPDAGVVAGTISLAEASSTQQEPESGVSEFDVELRRTGGTYGAVTIAWTIDGATADDFVDTSGTATFGQGETSLVVTLGVRADGEAELNEDFVFRVSLELAAGQMADLGDRNTVSLTILVNDQPSGYFGFTAAQANGVSEVEEGASQTFVVLRNLSTQFAAASGRILATTAIVEWRLSNSQGGGAPSRDFVGQVAGVVSFAVGQTAAVIRLTVRQDATPETFERFTLQLISASGQGRLVADSAHVGIPANEDPHGVVSVTTATVRTTFAAGALGRILEVDIGRAGSRLGNVDVTIQVAYTSSNGEGTADVLADDTLTTRILAGSANAEPVRLSILSTALLSVTGRFTVTVTEVAVTGALGDDDVFSNAVIGTSQQTATPPAATVAGAISLRLQGASSTFLEPAAGTRTYSIPIVRTGGSYGRLSFAWAIVGGDPNSDFSVASGSGVFENQEFALLNTIRISVVADDVPEINEDYVVRISLTGLDNDEVGTVGIPASHAFIIGENDVPYGVVGIHDAEVMVYEPTAENVSPVTEIVVTRSEGTFDETVWDWRITPTNAAAAELSETGGRIIFGDRVQNATIRLSAQDDETPEMPQTFVLEISQVSGRAGAGRTRTNIVIPGNDFPFGKFSILDSVNTVVAVESPLSTNAAEIVVIREAGTNGNIYIPFRVTRINGNDDVRDDISPEQGAVHFAPGATRGTFEVSILQDQLPEDDERFLVELLEPFSDNSILAPPSCATCSSTSVPLLIPGNDEPISFNAASVDPQVNESDVFVTLVVDRGGGQTGASEVAWSAQNLSPDDIASPILGTLAGVINFEDGETTATFNVNLRVDSTPQPDRYFRVTLRRTSEIGAGDVPDDGSQTTVWVRANPGFNLDGEELPAGGLFRFNTANVLSRISESHGDLTITVNRIGGTFGSVVVFWRINDGCRGDFSQDAGRLSFIPSQASASLVVSVEDDNIPEQQHECTFELYRIRVTTTGTGTAVIDERFSVVEVELAANDGIFGIFAISDKAAVTVSEEPAARAQLSVDVDRCNDASRCGRFGSVRVEWYIVADTAPDMPNPTNLLLAGSLNHAVTPRVSDRDVSTLPMYEFDGRGSSIDLTTAGAALFDVPIIGAFTIAFRIRQAGNTDGYLWGNWVGDQSNPDTLYALRSRSGSAGTGALIFEYSSTVGVSSEVIFAYPEDVDDSEWRHIAFVRSGQNGRVYYSAFFDGEMIGEPFLGASPVLRQGGSRSNAFIGKDFGSTAPYRGFIQEVQFYPLALSTEQISELYSPVAAAELFPSSGLVWFLDNQATGTITTQARNDDIPEIAEGFSMFLRHVGDGGLLEPDAGTGKDITIRHNDNAYGRFGFPEEVYRGWEGAGVSIPIERQDGAFNEVTLTWQVTGCQECNVAAGDTCTECESPVAEDVNVTTGTVTFAAGQRTGYVVIGIIEDQENEFVERLTLQIVQVSPGVADAVQHSTVLQIGQSGFPYGRFLLAAVIGDGPPLTSVTLDEDSGELTLKIGRTDRLAGDISVDFFIEPVNYGCSYPDDIEPSATASQRGALTADSPSGSVRFADNQSTATFSINIVDDDIPELAERFNVRLRPTAEQTGYADVYEDLRTVAVTIRRNDVPDGNLAFGSNSYALDEGSELVIVVERRRGTFGSVSASWEIISDDDDLAAQISPLTGTVSFDEGQSTATVILTGVDEDGTPIAEVARSVGIRLFDPAGGALIDGSDGAAEITLTANDDTHGAFLVFPLGQEFDEPIEDSGVTMVLQRVGGSIGSVDVAWETQSGTAVAGEDFVGASGVETFADGETTKTIRVTLLADNLPEILEEFTLAITTVAVASADSGAPFGEGATSPRVHPESGSIIIAIPANDVPGGLFYITQPDPATVAEGESLAFYVIRGAGAFGSATVTWNASLGDLTGEGEFEAATGTVSFADGESVKRFDLAAMVDGVPELPESFVVGLQGVTTGTGLSAAVGTTSIDGAGATEFIGGASNVTIAISENENARGVLIFEPASLQRTVEEPANSATTVVFVLRRVAGAFGAVAVQCILSDGAGNDVSPSQRTVEFSDSERRQTVEFSVLPDNVPELVETFNVRLANPQGGAVLGAEEQTIATVVIPENDAPYGTFNINSATISAIEPSRNADDVGEAEDEDITATTTLTIPVIREGGDFGSVTLQYQTFALSEAQMLNDAVAGSNLPLLFHVFDSPVEGKLTVRGGILRRARFQAVQDCLTACLATVSCQSINFNGLSSVCELLSVVVTASQQVEDASGFVYYQIDPAERASELADRRASDPFDYHAGSGSIEFSDGQALGHIEIELVQDDIPELIESFGVRIFNPLSELGTANLGAIISSRINIAANDVPHGLIIFNSTLSTSRVEEANGVRVRLALQRTAGTFAAVTVGWRTNHPLGQDLRGSRSGQVTFQEGDTHRFQFVDFIVLDDDVPELDEGITFSLVQVADSLATISDETHTVVTAANDNANGMFAVVPRTISVNEPSRVRLNVIRQQARYGFVNIRWSVTAVSTSPDGTSVDRDLNASFGFVRFENGQQSGYLDVYITDDNIAESHEMYTVAIEVHSSQHSLAVINPQYSRSTVTVRANDDPHGVFSFAPNQHGLTVDEDDGSVRLVVQRTYGDMGAVIVTYEVHSVNATTDDFATVPAANGLLQVTFEDGQVEAEIQVNILADDVPEEAEMFQLRLVTAELDAGETRLHDGESASPRLDALSDADLVASVIIEQNDNPRGVFILDRATASVEESEASVILTVDRQAGNIGRAFLTWEVQFCSDLDCSLPEQAAWITAGDISTVSGGVGFIHNQDAANITIGIVDDDIPEEAEAFIVTLTDTNSGSLGGQVSTLVMIGKNDDANGLVRFAEAAANPTLTETDAITFVLVRDRGVFEEVEVDYMVVQTGNDEYSGDVRPRIGTVRFAAGESITSIELTVEDDTVPEFDETFELRLTAVEPATFANVSLVRPFTVAQNDHPYGLPEFPLNPTFRAVDEADRTVHVPVTRTHGSLGSMTVRWTTSDNAAVASAPADSDDVWLHATSVQPDLTFSHGGWCFVNMSSGEQALLGLSADGSSQLYATHKGTVYATASSTVAGASCVGVELEAQRFFSVASAAGASIYRYEDGALHQVFHMSGSYAHASHINRASGAFVLFGASDSASRSILVGGSIGSDGAAAFARVQTIDLTGVTSMESFTHRNVADGTTDEFVVAATAANRTSILKLEQGSALRVVYSFGSDHGSSWTAVMAEQSTYLVCVSANGLVTMSRFTGTQLARPQEYEPASILATTTVLTEGDNVYLLGTGPSGASVLFYLNEETVRRASLDTVDADFGVASNDKVMPFTAIDSMTRIIGCTDVCALFRQDAVAVLSDYAAPASGGWISFQEGETEAYVSIGLINDVHPELDEDFTVRLLSYEPEDGTMISTTHTVVISRNDNAFGLLGFAAGSLSQFIEEPANAVERDFVVERTGGTFGPGRCGWTVLDTEDTSDVFPLNGILDFEAGQTSASITLTIRADNEPEVAEVFSIGLVDAELGPTINDDRGVATITVGGNDAVYGIFSIVGAAARTVEEQAGPVRFEIVRTGGDVGQVNVAYNITAGVRTPTATADGDFTATAGVVSFAPQSSLEEFTVTVLGDREPEQGEWFSVTLTGVVLESPSVPEGQLTDSALALGDQRRVDVQIEANDDASGVFGFEESGFSVEEGGSIQAVVTRTGGVFGRCVVHWSARFGTASRADTDLEDASGTLEFAPGQQQHTVTVGIVDDTAPEAEEQFTLSLDLVTGGIEDDAPSIDQQQSTSVVTISENDEARGVLEVTTWGAATAIAEGDDVVFGIVRSLGTVGELLFSWEAAANSAGFDASDINPSSQNISFADGEGGAKNISFAVLNDEDPEGAERFVIQLGEIHGGARVSESAGSARYTIAANDNGNGVFGFDASSVSVVALDEGVAGSNIALNVTRGVAQFGAVRIGWSIERLCAGRPNNCVNEADFAQGQPLSGVLQFADGDTVGAINVAIRGDSVPEGDERFAVTLAAPESDQSLTINPSRAVSSVTILANDNGQGVFSWASDALMVPRAMEGTPLNLTVIRQVAQFGSVTLDWTIVDVTGQMAASDFAPVAGTVNFGEGNRSKVVEIAVLDDSIPELLERYFVVLSCPLCTAGQVSSAGRSQIRILPNDEPLGVVSVRDSVRLVDLQGDLAGLRALEFDVQRVGGTLEDINIVLEVGYTSGITYAERANVALVPELCSRGRCEITIPADDVGVSHSIALPQAFFYGAGDVFTVTAVAATHSGAAGLPNDSPRISPNGATGRLVVPPNEADSVVGFSTLEYDAVDEGRRIPVRITRQATRGSITVDWAVVGAGSDIDMDSGSVTFRQGEATKSLTLSATNDAEPELQESFRIDVTAVRVDPTGNTIATIFGNQSSTVAISASDDPHGVFALAATGRYDVSEDGPPAVITIARGGGAFGDVSVVMSLTSTGATAADYTVSGATAQGNGTFVVQFAHGDSSADIAIAATDDEIPETEQSIRVQLVQANAARSSGTMPPRIDGRNAAAQLYIASSDSPEGMFGFEQPAISVDENGGNVILTVVRNGGTHSAVSIGWASAPGNGIVTAEGASEDQESGPDFGNRQGTLRFGAGVTRANITIPILQDDIPELDEIFVITLVNPRNGAEIDEDTDHVAVTILANDNPNGAIGFDSRPILVEEDVGTVQIPVHRTGGAHGEATVLWRVQQRIGSNFSLQDIDPIQGVVTFEAGSRQSNVLLAIANDGEAEIAESFDIVLLSPSEGAGLEATASITVTIQEHGNPHGVIGFECQSRYGGNNADGRTSAEVQLIVERQGGSVGPVTVRVQTSFNGSALASEFTRMDTVVSFAHGEQMQIITLETEALQVQGTSKDVLLYLTQATGGAIINDGSQRSTVTLYASTFTNQLITEVQEAVCGLDDVSASLGVGGSLLTQVEFDRMVVGIQDLYSSGMAEAPAGQNAIEGLMNVIADPQRLGPDVQNNRRAPNLLQSYALYKYDLQVNLQVNANRRRQDETCAADETDSVLQLNAAGVRPLVNFGVARTDNIIAFNGMLFSSVPSISTEHKALLPVSVFRADADADCVSVTHGTFLSSALFPATHFWSDNIDTAGNERSSDLFQVLQGRIISVTVSNPEQRSDMSFADPFRFAIPNDQFGLEELQCVWWSEELDAGTGAWTSKGCRTAEDESSIQTSDFSIICECTEASGEHFAVMAPEYEFNQVAMISQVSHFILLAAIFAVLLVYRCYHKDRHTMETFNVSLLMQLFTAVGLTQLLAIISFGVSTDAGPEASQAIGAILHLFFTAQMTWIITIGVNLYTKYLRGDSAAGGQPRFWSMFGFAWGSALLVVMLYLVSDYSNRDSMAEVYGWIDPRVREFSFIPTKNDNGVYGAVVAVLALTGLVVVTVFVKHSSSPDWSWRTNDDLFPTRANGKEIKIICGLFALIVLTNTTLLLFVYEQSKAWEYIELILSIVTAIYILVYYAVGPSTESIIVSNKSVAMSPTSMVGIDESTASPQNSFVLQPFSPAPAFENPAYLSSSRLSMAGMSRASLTAGFQDSSVTEQTAKFSPSSHQLDVTQLQRSQTESKAMLVEPPAQEQEFDDLVYTLQNNTFEGGEESVSVKSLKLDTTTKDFVKRRTSIRDTHL